MTSRKPPFYQNPFLLSFLSGLLLTFSFPGLRLGFLAWIALVPFFVVLNQAKTRSEAIGLSMTMGLTFFLCSMHWLTFVTAAGWLVMAFLETSFLVFFGLAFLEFRNFEMGQIVLNEMSAFNQEGNFIQFIE